MRGECSAPNIHLHLDLCLLISNLIKFLLSQFTKEHQHISWLLTFFENITLCVATLAGMQHALDCPQSAALGLRGDLPLEPGEHRHNKSQGCIHRGLFVLSGGSSLGCGHPGSCTWPQHIHVCPGLLDGL